MSKHFFLLLISFYMIGNICAQNIGIGTTNPLDKLHVAGAIRADSLKTNVIKIASNAGAGKVLTSDASGNANWQTSAASGNTGYGVWGDCATNGNITDYRPVADPNPEIGKNTGASVATSGNFAIVGAPGDGPTINTSQGSVSIYQYTGGAWVFMQKLVDPAAENGDQFGSSVAISGNYAIVGAYTDDVGSNIEQGSALIFRYDGNNWIFMQKLVDPNGATNDYFGGSVSISGNFAIVGAAYDDEQYTNQGSACIYQFNGSTWTFLTKLTDPNAASGDLYGCSVSVSGNFAVVGAFADDEPGKSDQGSAHIYLYGGSNWIFIQKLSDPNGAFNDYFGYSVSISGNYLVVGASRDDLGSGRPDQGSATVYHFNGSTWEFSDFLYELTFVAYDYFGSSVSISGDFIIVGTPYHEVAGKLQQGSCVIFVRLGLGWQRLQVVSDPGGKAIDLFGTSAAIDGNTKHFLIGAPAYMSASGKAVFGKVN